MQRHWEYVLSLKSGACLAVIDISHNQDTLGNLSRVYAQLSHNPRCKLLYLCVPGQATFPNLTQLSWNMCLCVQSFSQVQLFATTWTAAHQAPLSMGFSRQEYWSGLPFPPPGDLPHPGNEPTSPALQAYSLPLRPRGSPSWNIGMILTAPTSQGYCETWTS